MAHGDLPDPLQADAELMRGSMAVRGPQPAAAEGAGAAQGAVMMAREDESAGANVVIVQAAGEDANGGWGDGGCTELVPLPVPQRPGRVVDFGAGTGRWVHVGG